MLMKLRTGFQKRDPGSFEKNTSTEGVVVHLIWANKANFEMSSSKCSCTWIAKIS